GIATHALKGEELQAHLLGKAKRWLKDLLRHKGPLQSADVFRQAKEASVSRPRVFPAARALHVVRRRRDPDNGKRAFYWCLPGQELPGLAATASRCSNGTHP